MNNDLHSKTFILDESGNIQRIGDYLAGSVTEMPFSLQADGMADFVNPTVSGRGNDRTMTWLEAKGKLEITARYQYDESAGIISRRDTLVNRTKKKIMIRKYAARFTFNPGE